MCNKKTLTQEEQFIFVIDRYIIRHANNTRDNAFYRKLYVIFVGYHLKYFYDRVQYSDSCFHVDNIMQMFIGVTSSLNGCLLRRLANSNSLLHCLNSLVNYISDDVDEAERIYTVLLAQYENKRIARSITYIPPRTIGRKRL